MTLGKLIFKMKMHLGESEIIQKVVQTEVSAQNSGALTTALLGWRPRATRFLSGPLRWWSSSRGPGIHLGPSASLPGANEVTQCSDYHSDAACLFLTHLPRGIESRKSSLCGFRSHTTTNLKKLPLVKFWCSYIAHDLWLSEEGVEIRFPFPTMKCVGLDFLPIF